MQQESKETPQLLRQQQQQRQQQHRQQQQLRILPQQQQHGSTGGQEAFRTAAAAGLLQAAAAAGAAAPSRVAAAAVGAAQGTLNWRSEEAATAAGAAMSLRTAEAASRSSGRDAEAAYEAEAARGDAAAAAEGSTAATTAGEGETATTRGSRLGGRERIAAAGTAGKTTPDALLYHHPLASSTIVISQRQRTNPLLRFVRGVPVTVENVVPDFLVGVSACVLFLSLRYHQLYPKYISNRIHSLQQKRYARRFLLLHVDLDVPDAALAQVTVLAFHNSYSLLLGSSIVECAGLLQLLKIYENKPPDALLARKQDVSHSARAMELLSTVSAVNKTDALTLAREFSTMKNLLTASKERLEKCHGIGVKKVKRMTKVFHDPFFAPC